MEEEFERTELYAFPEIIFQGIFILGVRYKMSMDVNKIARLGVLSALGVILVLLVRFPIIPSASFLVYEPGDVVILIGAFMFGPVAGLIMTVVVSLIQALTVSADSGWIGFVMHVLATGTLVVVASSIYKRMHNFKGAVIALIAGALSMTLVMVPANLFFTVKFYGVPYDAVKAMLLPAIIPFNLIKAFGNTIIVLLIYKPLSRAISGLGNMRPKKV
jgi:riboflavin transporter FmnP